jgi:hypothetical protein
MNIGGGSFKRLNDSHLRPRKGLDEINRLFMNEPV